MREAEIMYLGMREFKGDFSHKFIEIDEDNSPGKVWSFSSKLFSKGTIGAVYTCKLEGDNISYSKKTCPRYVLQVSEGHGKGTSILFPKLISDSEILNDQALVVKRNGTKTKSSLDKNIEEIRENYKELSSQKQSRFIADLVYKITR